MQQARRLGGLSLDAVVQANFLRTHIGLACFVVFLLVPGTLSLRLLCLDELRLFGLLCLTAVCDHIICIFVGGRISTGSGCTDVVG